MSVLLTADEGQGKSFGPEAASMADAVQVRIGIVQQEGRLLTDLRENEDDDVGDADGTEVDGRRWR